MNSDKAIWAQVQETLKDLHQELSRLSERVSALEKQRGSAAEALASPAVAAAAPAADEEISEEIVAVLGAAIAAYLGKRAPIRQIRLLGSSAWSQQGRVIIQGSHHR